MAKETKEFAWDTETKIGEFGDAKKKTEVRICTLNGKTYVSAQSYVMSAKTSDWKRTKNNTMEMSIFKELQDFVGKWEMMDAFGSETKAEAPKQKKPTRKETDKAVSKAVEKMGAEDTAKKALKAKKTEPKAEKKPRAKKATK